MGTVVLSVDAELGWGYHDLEDPPVDRLVRSRLGWIRLVHLLDRFEVPATWAVVGHLMLAECDGVHADHPSPPGWFDHETGAWADRPEWRFGRGLVRAVRSAAVDHEVGCHGFSHLEFDAAGTTRRMVEAELTASLAAMRDHGERPRSFVFPRNGVAYRDVLADHGFTCYRGPRPQRAEGLPYARPVLKLLRGTVTAPPVLEPRVDEYGLVNVPASMGLFGFEDGYRTVAEAVWDDPMVREAVRGIDRAAGRDSGVFHLWFHPNDLVERRDVRRVERVLAHIARRREETPLSVETMGSVAERTLGSADRTPTGSPASCRSG